MNHLSSPQTAIKTIILLHYNLKIYCFDTYKLIYLVCSISTCLCGCVHVCMYMLVWVCTCVHLNACGYVYTCTSTCLCGYVHACIYMFVWACTHVHTGGSPRLTLKMDFSCSSYAETFSSELGALVDSVSVAGQ